MNGKPKRDEQRTPEHRAAWGPLVADVCGRPRLFSAALPGKESRLA
jgi:hypothetical protein